MEARSAAGLSDSMKNLVFIISALYVLSPVDLVPELAAGRFGLIDDLLVVGILYWHFIYRPARLKASRQAEEDAERAPVEEGGREEDPYRVLGVAKDAPAEEIKHAYRELANKYHPDKVSHMGEEFKVIAHKKFKEIQRAYQELTEK